MKIDKADVKQSGGVKNLFSKVADMKIPDSPPPEKEDDEGIVPADSKPGMTKFDKLMKAAVSIKTAQLD